MHDDFEVWVGLAGGTVLGATAVLVFGLAVVVAVTVVLLTVHTWLFVRSTGRRR